MKISKIVIAITLFVLSFSFMGSPAMAQEQGKGGKSAGKMPTTMSSQGAGATGTFSGLKGEDGILGALEELKLISSDVTKKTNVNRNLIVGSTVANVMLLLMISGLLGFSLSGDKQNTSNQQSGGSGSNANPATADANNQ